MRGAGGVDLPADIRMLYLAGSLLVLKSTFVAGTPAVLPNAHGTLVTTISRARIDAFLEVVPMKPGEFLIDLGCGDGRVLRKARRRYGVETLGFELNPFAYLKARLLSLGRPGVRITWRNFWTADLSRADFIFCHLFADVMGDLGKRLKLQLRPGAVVVSANFAVPDWQPERILSTPDDPSGDLIYLYRIDE